MAGAGAKPDHALGKGAPCQRIPSRSSCRTAPRSSWAGAPSPPGRSRDDLRGADIVFVATDDEDVNARAYRDASEAHLMVNVADRPELCTFFLPSVLRRGKLSIAVSTEGASPLTARRLRKELEERIPGGFEAYLDLLAAWRPRAIAALPDEAARYRFWQQATDGRVQRLVQAADEEAAEHLLEELLEGERTACATLL